MTNSAYFVFNYGFIYFTRHHSLRDQKKERDKPRGSRFSVTRKQKHYNAVLGIYYKL